MCRGFSPDADSRPRLEEGVSNRLPPGSQCRNRIYALSFAVRLSPGKWDQAQLILTVFYAGLVDISTNKEYQRYVNLKEVSYRED